jgi:hypothetical protein
LSLVSDTILAAEIALIIGLALASAFFQPFFFFVVFLCVAISVMPTKLIVVNTLLVKSALTFILSFKWLPLLLLLRR